MNRTGLIVAICLSLGSASFAEDFYVAQTALGLGATAEAATNYLFFNTSGNWGVGAGKISPGDTVHLVGTLTNKLTAQSSGSSGSPITIYFEPDAKLSAPTLATGNYWLSVGGKSWITIDGGSNGIIELTDNGTVATNGGTMTYGNSCGGLYADPVSHLTVQNLRIRNIFQRQTNSEAIQGTDGIGMYWTGSDVVVSNCFISEAEKTLSGIYGSTATSNLTITSCIFSNYNHGISLGSGGVTNPLFFNVTITRNTFQGGDMFESPDDVELGFHRNAIFLYNESPVRDGCISNIVIAYNFIKHGNSPRSSVAGTGAMFFDFYNDEMAKHVRVFNNISTLVAPLSWSGGGGFIAGSGTDVLVANNTAIAWQTNGVTGGVGEISGGGTNVFIYNNICISRTGIRISTHANTTGLTNNPATVAALLSGIWADHNIYNQQGNNSFQEVIFSDGGSTTWQSGLVDNFAQWTNIWSGILAPHLDPHSTTANVSLDANFIPISTDTVAIGAGTNLTSWGITDDYAGNARPATGPWTIGAYEVSAAEEAPAATMPTHLRLRVR